MEDPDFFGRDFGLACCFKEWTKQFRFGDQELDLGGLDVVAELVLGVGRIRAGEDASGGVDAHDQDWIVDIVEGMDANAIAGLKTGRVEASN